MEGVIATIIMFAGNFAPKNWVFCAGQTIQISSNTALFSLIGTYYGGNGTSNFLLPNLQGRVAVGAGQGPGLSDYQVGQASGAETATMSTSQMPVHGHAGGSVAIPLSTTGPTTEQPNNNILASPTADTYASLGTPPTVNYGGFSAEVAPAGGNQPFSIKQPFLGMNFLICQYGIYPSRP